MILQNSIVFFVCFCFFSRIQIKRFHSHRIRAQSSFFLLPVLSTLILDWRGVVLVVVVVIIYNTTIKGPGREERDEGKLQYKTTHSHTHTLLI